MLTSTLTINCYLRNFLNKSIGIINLAKPFLNFKDDTMILYLYLLYLFIFFAPVSVLFPVESLSISLLYLDLYVLGDDALIS